MAWGTHATLTSYDMIATRPRTAVASLCITHYIVFTDLILVVVAAALL